MLLHQGTQTLRTPRLVLRRFTVEDAQAMFDTWANDPQVTRYLTWRPHGSPELTRQLLETWCAAYERPNFYNWALERDGKVAGNISVVRLSERSEYAELGYCMGRAYWNQGLMTEAAQAVIDYLFARVGVHRVGISHAVKNPASGKVARKCGLQAEGVKREFFKTPEGEYLDIADYGVLRSEWEALQAGRRKEEEACRSH